MTFSWELSYLKVIDVWVMRKFMHAPIHANMAPRLPCQGMFHPSDVMHYELRASISAACLSKTSRFHRAALASLFLIKCFNRLGERFRNLPRREPVDPGG
jgi:hypothetical protein